MLWEQALATLKRPNPETHRFDNWAVIPAIASGIEGGFYLINVIGNGEYRQSGLIEHVEWQGQWAKDVAGNTYLLGRIHHEFLDYLKRVDSELLRFAAPENLVPNNLYRLSVDTVEKSG